MISSRDRRPNKSPEPTAALALFCFSDALSPPWLSFFR